MNRPKPLAIIAVLIALLIGIAAGAASAYWLIGNNTHEVMRSLVAGQALETIKHARQLREGDTESVLADREKSLELIVNWYRAFEYTEPGDIQLLYSVKDHRDKWGLQMPEDINQYLDQLPPKPVSSPAKLPRNKKITPEPTL